MPTRREFVQVTAAATAATVLRTRGVLGANDRINIGIIGCGGRGQQDWQRFLKQPDVNPVAACDVYEPFLKKATEGTRVVPYKDFRRLLERKDVDAVIVATPDHWHALITTLACEAGKDVYCEKPLSLTIHEGRVMADAARKHGRVVQTGSQQRSGAHYQKAVKLVQDGAIGPVHKISAGFTRNVIPGFVARELKNGLTPELDWDMWLGPAPFVAFNPYRCIYHFRWFWNYSGGQMTNFGAHDLDIARWALQARAPASVAAFGGRYEMKDGGETPDVQEVIYDFPDAMLGGGKGCIVSWTGREIGTSPGEPLVFHGTKGTLSLSRRGFKVAPETWKGDPPSDKPAMEPMQEPGSDMDATHVRNFLDSVKSRKTPIAEIEEGHRTATMCHLGNIATRLGRSLRWDAQKEEFVSDPDANRRLHYDYRKPWKL
ncbi:MAG TPA: Gfo/Idh/MocA family oxidoreductase [Vicinamibacterales bacterium]|nr:Gfo/Idh/MocA family oxidoreductase [Vicinamibacterales bacterium]